MYQSLGGHTYQHHSPSKTTTPSDEGNGEAVQERKDEETDEDERGSENGDELRLERKSSKILSRGERVLVHSQKMRNNKHSKKRRVSSVF